MGRKPKNEKCGHIPVLMPSPDNPDWVSVECLACHVTTGYTRNPQDAWDAWERGDVTDPYDLMEDE